MKLFLALAFVAIAAAFPEPIRLPEPAKPLVAELENPKVDPVRFVDSAPAVDENGADAVKIVEAPAQEDIQVDAVRFVDSAPEDTPVVDAVKIADAPALAEEEIQVDAVRFVDSAPEDTPVVDAVKIADAPALAEEEIQVDAVRFVDSAPEDTPVVDAVKIADAPALAEEEIQVDAVRFVDSAPEDTPAADAVEESQVDAVRFVDSPLPEVSETIPDGHIYTYFELARQAKEMQPEDAVFVHAPLVQFISASQDEEVDAVRFVESPVEQDFIKIADLPAPITLQAAPLPVVKENQIDAVKFVNNPQDVVSPLEIQPILPIDAGVVVVPQQIMDIIMLAEQIMAAQEQPNFGNIFVDPMLR